MHMGELPMNTKPLLPIDYARCHGVSCDQKETCLRYLARKDDLPYMQRASFGYFDSDTPLTFRCDSRIVATPEEIAIAKERGAL